MAFESIAHSAFGLMDYIDSEQERIKGTEKASSILSIHTLFHR